MRLLAKTKTSAREAIASERNAMTSANPVTLPLQNYTAQHALLAVAGAVATITLNRRSARIP